jgi:hypothetical protein
MAKRKTKKSVAKKTSVAETTVRKRGMGLAIVGLILNVLILPGLGSLIGGRIRVGIWQIVLTVIGFVLWGFEIANGYISIPIIAVAWIWGIVTSVSMIQEAE